MRIGIIFKTIIAGLLIGEIASAAPESKGCYEEQSNFPANEVANQLSGRVIKASGHDKWNKKETVTFHFFVHGPKRINVGSFLLYACRLINSTSPTTLIVNCAKPNKDDLIYAIDVKLDSKTIFFTRIVGHETSDERLKLTIESDEIDEKNKNIDCN